MHNFNKYLTPSSVDEKWGFFITTVGCSKIDANQNYPNTREHPASHYFTWNKGRILDDYYLVYISKGRGTFESSETKPFEINAGTCFFLYYSLRNKRFRSTQGNDCLLIISHSL